MVRRPLCLACAAFVIMIMLILSMFPPPFYELGEQEGKYLCLTGRVTNKELKNNVFTVSLDDVRLGKQYKGMQQPKGVVCRLEGDAGILETTRLGSYLFLSGKAESFEPAGNVGEFDQLEYYRAKGIDFCLKSARILKNSSSYNIRQEYLFRFRQKLEIVYERVFPDQQAGVMKAMILGSASELDSEIKEEYQKSGIAHLLVISGQHISIIGLGLYMLLGRIGFHKKIAAVLSLLIIIQYGTMTGMGSSTQRAVIMFGVFLLAELSRRSYDMITAMAFTAVMILFWQPLQVFQPGFQLSFGAVMGIGLLYPTLFKIFSIKNKIFSLILSSFSISFFTLPILMFSYSSIPTYSILLNLFVVPLMTFLLPFGIGLIPVFYCSAFFAEILSYPCRFILMLYHLVCSANAVIPGNTLVTGRPELYQVIIFYAGILALILVFEYQGSLQVIFALTLLTLILTWRIPVACNITMMDVGQGDCILIEAEGKNFLIDGGSSSKSKVGQYKIIPALKAMGISELDAIIITHGDQDHMSGIPELLSFHEKGGGIWIRQILLPNLPVQSEEGCNELANLALKARIPVSYIKKGDRLCSEEMELVCLNPDKTTDLEDSNSASIALFMEYKEFQALFTGDITGEGESKMVKELKKMKESGKNVSLDYLKVAHHGSQSSTPEELLKLTNPKAAFISAGENNSYGHPHKELLDRLNQIDCMIFTTSEYGQISVITDGKKIKIRTRFSK